MRKNKLIFTQIFFQILFKVIQVKMILLEKKQLKLLTETFTNGEFTDNGLKGGGAGSSADSTSDGSEALDPDVLLRFLTI